MTLEESVLRAAAQYLLPCRPEASYYDRPLELRVQHPCVVPAARGGADTMCLFLPAEQSVGNVVEGSCVLPAPLAT